MKRLAFVAAAAVLAAGGAALAQAPPPGARPPGPPPPPARGPALDLAVEAAQTAIATCQANGYKVSAVVVNSAGDTRAVLAADGAPSMTVAFATRKAYTANAFKKASGQVGEDAKADKALADKIAADPKMITWAGGEPLVAADGSVVGALGVGGAPGGDKDDVCTNAAIAKIKDRLK